MRHLRSFYFVLTLFFMLMTSTTNAFAGEGDMSDYFGGIGTKLGRGVWNVVSSPAEIPCTIKSERSGAWTGLGLGSARMFRRMFIGATEIMTFVIPMDRTIPHVCREDHPDPHGGV